MFHLYLNYLHFILLYSFLLYNYYIILFLLFWGYFIRLHYLYYYVSGITGVSGQTIGSSLYPQGTGIDDPFP